MGKMADHQLNANMQAAGRMFFDQVRSNYRRAGWTFVSGREEGAVLDGAAQSLFASFVERYQHTPGMLEQAVDAVAHVAALVIYQQSSLDWAKADFMRRVDKFGLEFAKDSSAGEA